MLGWLKKQGRKLTTFLTEDDQELPKYHISNKDKEDPSKTKISNEEKKLLPDAVKTNSTKLEPQIGPLPVYKVPLKKKNTEINGCTFFSFGECSKVGAKQRRTIMVLGATGAGKSTLINGMINYILGVQWSDCYRFVLVDDGPTKSQAHSQTSEVTVYKLNHRDGFEVPFSLTIIDTPGFGDTRGIDRDREITEQLRNLFTSKDGVSEIDAVCFVAQAALARLTPTQKYVFDSILSIFGKDIAENIRILVTFADGQKPPVLEAIKASGVPSPKGEDDLPVHFKFNNSALFADNKSSAADTQSGDDDGNFDQMFWNMGTKSMKRFFTALNQMTTKSLTMTNEVLRERQQLEVSVENLQVNVTLGLTKLEEIRETRETIKKHEAEISRNEKFEFELTVKKPIQIDISGTGHFITNCSQCYVTCHKECGIPDDKNKKRCVAMNIFTGYCTQCPGKCYWNVHFNQKYRWEYTEVTEKRTVEDLRENFEKATGKKMTVEGLMRKLEEEYSIMQHKVNTLIDKSAKCLNRLKEIALKPNPLTTPEYIDMLIEGEKQEAKQGWKKRVESLINMKHKAEYMAKVEKGEKPSLTTIKDLEPQISMTTNEEIKEPEANKNSNENPETPGSTSKVEKGGKPSLTTIKDLEPQAQAESVELKESMTTNEEIKEPEANKNSNENPETPGSTSKVEKGGKPSLTTIKDLEPQAKAESVELEESMTTNEEIKEPEANKNSNENPETPRSTSEVEKGGKPSLTTIKDLEPQAQAESVELEESMTTNEEIKEPEANKNSNENPETPGSTSKVEKGGKPSLTTIKDLEPQAQAESVELEESMTTNEEIKEPEANKNSNENPETPRSTSEVEKGGKPSLTTIKDLEPQAQAESVELEESMTTNEEIKEPEANKNSNENPETPGSTSKVEKGGKPSLTTIKDLEPQAQTESVELEGSMTTNEEIKEPEAIRSSNDKAIK